MSFNKPLCSLYKEAFENKISMLLIICSSLVKKKHKNNNKNSYLLSLVCRENFKNVHLFRKDCDFWSLLANSPSLHSSAQLY